MTIANQYYTDSIEKNSKLNDFGNPKYRKNAAETMKLVVAETGGYSAPDRQSSDYYNNIKNKINSNNKVIEWYKNELEKKENEYENAINKLKNISDNNSIGEEEKENQITEISQEIGRLATQQENIKKNINVYLDNNQNILDELNKSYEVQYEPNNLVPSISEHRVSDGQKRYKTLGKTTSSNYPRPKTLFKVFFIPNGNDGVDNTICNELTKYVLEVTKPTITYTTKQMNQYNRIKYVYDNVKYGPLKITFMDVKDNFIQQAFFSYMRDITYDFPYTGNFNSSNGSKADEDDDKYNTYENLENWGLKIDSNKKIFKSIVICEYFLNKIMVYTIENPTFKDINFGSNKIGDYGYNEITVSFDVEGITNVLRCPIDINHRIGNVIGKNIIDLDDTVYIPEKLAEVLGMRWHKGSGTDEDSNDYLKDILENNTNIKDANAYAKLKTSELLSTADSIEYKKEINAIKTSYADNRNKNPYYWFDMNRTQLQQAGLSTQDFGYTGSKGTANDISRNMEELAELGMANDSNYSSGNALDALLGVVTSPQDISKLAAPRIKQLFDHFKF